MDKYYFDTSVWIAYFDEKEFYHKEAVKWFEKVKEGIIIASDIVDREIQKKKPEFYSRFLNMFDILSNIRFANASEEDKKTADEYSKTTEFAFGDLLHLLIVRRYDFIPVSADIHHWPKIARMFEIYNLNYITDINF